MSYERVKEMAESISVRGAAAARLVGVSPSTLERWRRSGRIPSVKIAGTRLYRVEDLKRLVIEGEGGAA